MDAPVYTDVAARTKRERYASLRAQLWTERSSFDAHWRELGDYLLPRRTRFWSGDRNRGDKRNQNIIDSTARFSARTLQSGLHAGLTSPARPWMKLTTPDPDLAEQGPVKEWLHVVTERMLTVFAMSNLYNVLPIVYGDMGVFGTAAMAVLDDPLELFRCYAYPVGSYALGLDARGRVGTFVREYRLSVRQVVETFGGPEGQPRVPGTPVDWSRISTGVRALWERSTFEAPVDVCWIVTPNEDADAGRLRAKYFPWSSCYFELGADAPTPYDQQGTFLRESGFREFPILAPRWDITGEDTYGTDCPGMTALGDVKQLQLMQREKAKAIAKIINPPIMGPSALKTQKTSLLPGDITYVDVREGMSGLRPIHEINNLNLADLTADIRETQYRIQRAFYEDLFLMLARSEAAAGTQPITAREVDERHEEKLLALGPVLERTNDELLNPLVDRVYALMERAGLIPEPPQVLQGVTIKAVYISIMAQAQKLVGVSGQDRLMSTVGPLIQFFPEIREKIDPMQLVDNYGDMLGVDPRVIRSTDVAEQRVATQQQAAQQAQDAANAQKLAAAAKSAGTTPMGGDTALSHLISNVTGAGAGGASLAGGG
jgi:hypothetical protein